MIWIAVFKGGNGWMMAVLAAFLAFTDGAEWRSPAMNMARLVIFCWLAGGRWLDGWLDQTFGGLKKPAANGPDTAAGAGGGEKKAEG